MNNDIEETIHAVNMDLLENSSQCFLSSYNMQLNVSIFNHNGSPSIGCTNLPEFISLESPNCLKKKQISSWFFSYARDVNSTNQLINSTLNRELFFNSILFSPRSDIVLPRRILLIFVRLCLYIDIIGMFRYLH